MLQIAVTGKPNVGKSSFFNSATSSSVEMANYPFTTIDANKAVAHVVSDCPFRLPIAFACQAPSLGEGWGGFFLLPSIHS